MYKEDTIECDWCEEFQEETEVKDTNYGKLCWKCIKALQSRGEDIIVKI